MTSSGYHQGIIMASSGHHQHIISALSAHHQPIISASSADHQCIISASSAHHEHIISTSCANHQHIMCTSFIPRVLHCLLCLVWFCICQAPLRHTVQLRQPQEPVLWCNLRTDLMSCNMHSLIIIGETSRHCTMGKLQWEVGNRIFFIFEREKYLEYLDTDKMGGKVDKSIWNILTLLKWEAKLAHWSGTKWTDSMFYITTDWKSIMNREKWKSDKKRQIFFPSPDQKIGSKYLKFHFFRL